MKKALLFTAIIIVAISVMTACNKNEAESIAETTESIVNTTETAPETTEETTERIFETITTVYESPTELMKNHDFGTSYDEEGRPVIVDFAETTQGE